MKKNEIKVKTTVNNETAQTLLENLVNSFKEGTVCIESGEEFITLNPGAQVEMELEAGQKKNKEKLVIELSWLQAAPEAEGADELKISSHEPVMVEAPVSAPPQEGTGF